VPAATITGYLDLLTDVGLIHALSALWEL